MTCYDIWRLTQKRPSVELSSRLFCRISSVEWSTKRASSKFSSVGTIQSKVIQSPSFAPAQIRIDLLQTKNTHC